jgi:hypothetical protein
MKSSIRIATVMLLTGMSLLGCGGGGGGGGDDSSDVAGGGSGWLIPSDEVVDGGPGKDGIPALTNPQFVPIEQSVVRANNLVIGILDSGEPRALPHDIMDWHEVLNTSTQDGPVVMSYCPLTGSALLWEANDADSDPTFGVSGLLYNSNLILYDRQTDSNWSQMNIQAVEGTRRSQVPTLLPLVEMTIESWREMYPDSTVLSRETGFSRDYDNYPYDSFRTNTELLFDVSPLDSRLHEKTRVLGVEVANVSRAYVIDDLDAELEVINDDINGVPILVAGSSNRRYAVSFERTLDDGTVLTFLPSDEPLPSIVSDNEGNSWDVFGRALTGTRAGQRLIMTQSHIAYWFAWGAFHPGSEIYEGN